jgi:Spy/CpxP family protein refolding chaperone
MEDTLRSFGFALYWMAAAAAAAHAQHDHRSPCASQAKAEIASLSAQDLNDLRAGAGMGLARAAELNHYPGPLHSLELADSLRLTPKQRSRIESIRETMLRRAIQLGAEIIEAERMLNQRFEHEHADSASIRELVTGIARLQGELRYTHLAAHLEVKNLLTAGQIAAYDRLRGYVIAR